VRDGPPLAYAAAVAPIEIDHEALSLAASGSNAHPAPIDASGLRAGLVEALAASGLFRSAVAIGEGEAAPGDPGGPSSRRRGRDEWLASARRSRADILVAARLERQDVRFARRNGLFIPNALLWVNVFPFIFPCWWVKDETYRHAISLDVDVVEARTGRVVARAAVRVDEAVPLDDFERGLVFFGLIRIPGALDGENWRKIARSSLPFAAAAAERALCVELERAFLPRPREEEGEEEPPAGAGGR
jgi:hypothetical protein